MVLFAATGSSLMRTIFHLDMDAFFVSVEELFDPSLKGKPVVVGGPADARGVVSAASYAARKFGVHSAMPLRTAYKLCPQAIFVNGHRERYSEYSRRVYEVLKAFTPQVSMASIDEAYLDVTGTERLHGTPLKAAHKLHEQIKSATQLNCSIGISQSRLVSKVASDQAKPNGVLWILPGQEARFLAPLDVRKIPGVGKVTERHLHECGIRKVGDLAALEADFLEEKFGKWGLALAGKAHGLDAGGWFDGEVGAHDDPKSISHEHTYDEDTSDRDKLHTSMVRLSEMVGRRLREHQLFAHTVQIKFRYSDFSTFTRAHTLDHGTQIDTEIMSEAWRLFTSNWNGGKIRLIGIGAHGLESQEGQMSLLAEPKQDRWRKALAAVDKIRDKYGDESVSLAGGLRGHFEKRVHENPEDLPGRHGDQPAPRKSDRDRPKS
jgi:DNA polymerase-4